MPRKTHSNVSNCQEDPLIGQSARPAAPYLHELNLAMRRELSEDTLAYSLKQTLCSRRILTHPLQQSHCSNRMQNVKCKVKRGPVNLQVLWKREINQAHVCLWIQWCSCFTQNKAFRLSDCIELQYNCLHPEVSLLQQALSNHDTCWKYLKMPRSMCDDTNHQISGGHIFSRRQGWFVLTKAQETQEIPVLTTWKWMLMNFAEAPCQEPAPCVCLAC